ncbi:hypothetical protein [Devosia sp.]|jgi:cytoskeletal protein RodZ|uniref:hypothetical protein n=1 Tax=Devosia sp. TaxID=1871048 RepID=UPI003BABA47B
MTLILVRLVIIVLVFGAIFLGARRIWRDWKGQFKQVDQARHDRDLKERARPDVVTLKRDKDGKFRQPDDK